MLEKYKNVHDFIMYFCECPVTGHSSRYVFFSKFFFSQVFPSLFLLICVLTSYNFRVNSVVWSPDGKQIASGSDDKTIKIWDSQSGDCQSTLTGHSGWYNFFSSYFYLKFYLCYLCFY